MKYKVNLTQAALNDLYVINEYYLAQVSDGVASGILHSIQSSIQKLTDLLERGSIPKELLITGMTRYRQIMFSVYRIIYRVEGNRVYVVMVIDGRRDVASALMRRQLM